MSVSASAPAGRDPASNWRGAAADAGRDLPVWALPAVLVIAAINFFWQLGSSGYYVDETLSIEHSLHSLSGVISVVRMTETTPPTYFLFLHEWLYRTGSQTEWVTRLPSAIAGVALIAVVYWMARAFVSRGPALGAAALCSLSPLVLEFAQQVRVYVFVMLAVTIAVGATVRAVGSSTARARLLIVGAVASVLAVWLHYTAWFVIFPLCVWVATRASIPRRARVAFIGVCLVAGLLEFPMFSDQYGYAPNGGAVGLASVTWINIVRIAGTPFDGRWTEGVDPIRLLGVATIGWAVLVLIMRPNTAVRHARLLAALGCLAPLGIFLIGVAGKDVLLTRYTAVAAPFLLTAVAAAIATLPRAQTIALLSAAVVVSGAGIARSHRQTGFYAPARETINYIAAHSRPGDVVVTTGNPGADLPLVYYDQEPIHPGLAYVTAAGLPGLVRSAHRRGLWIVREVPNDQFSDSTLLRLATLIHSSEQTATASQAYARSPRRRRLPSSKRSRQDIKGCAARVQRGKTRRS